MKGNKYSERHILPILPERLKSHLTTYFAGNVKNNLSAADFNGGMRVFGVVNENSQCKFYLG